MIATFLSHARFVSFVSKDLPRDSYPRFIPDSYPFAAICNQEPLTLWAATVKLQGPDLQKLGKQRGGLRNGAALFGERIAGSSVRKVCSDLKDKLEPLQAASCESELSCSACAVGERCKERPVLEEVASKKPSFHWRACQSKQVLVSAWGEALGAREEELLSENRRAKAKRARAIF